MRDNGTLRNTFYLLVTRPIFCIAMHARSCSSRKERERRRGEGGKKGRKEERKMKTREEIIRLNRLKFPTERYFLLVFPTIAGFGPRPKIVRPARLSSRSARATILLLLNEFFLSRDIVGINVPFLLFRWLFNG